MSKNEQKPVVVIVESVYKKGIDIFASLADLEVVPAPAAEEALSGVIKDKKAFAVVLGVEKYTGLLYEALQKGGVIARFGVGCDGIDFDKAKQKNLFVTNTPDVLESTVAEFTVFLAAEVLRKCGMADDRMKMNVWESTMGKELYGKTWAIIGLGRIGKRLGKILSFGFGVNVLAFKRNLDESARLGQTYGIRKISRDFAEIVSSADLVSLHLPANDDTYHFLDRKRLGQLKPGAVLINTGRGSLVDENALYEELKQGRLYGAGLDVFENEPYDPPNPEKDLRTLSNIVLTPHIASSTEECCKRMASCVIRNIRLALEDRHEQMDIVS
jgi:lactate dehydrogenase-like 2-hydroxyacid dehydrogenase